MTGSTHDRHLQVHVDMMKTLQDPAMTRLSEWMQREMEALRRDVLDAELETLLYGTVTWGKPVVPRSIRKPRHIVMHHEVSRDWTPLSWTDSPWRPTPPAFRARPGCTLSVTASGPIGLRLPPVDAATAARPLWKLRSTRSGANLNDWMTSLRKDLGDPQLTLRASPEGRH